MKNFNKKIYALNLQSIKYIDSPIPAEYWKLAFNIANRAIFQANLWANQIRGRDREFVWRKFQLAFALSTIESVTYPDSDGRRDLDLLWVATGGGKTEAYLLVMA